MSEQNYDEVICPNCTHQFRAVPVNVQKELTACQEKLAMVADALKFYKHSVANTDAKALNEDKGQRASDALEKIDEVNQFV